MAENVEVPLTDRVRQLERERDELRKDIEQLCMQKAGPSYLRLATQIHFQRDSWCGGIYIALIFRTDGLEQEIEVLKRKLITCARENENLKEELSEAHRIKSHLADIHNMEVAKKMDAEMQVKYFQSCIVAAFAERDCSVLEAESAKEKEELVSKKLYELQKRLEETMSSSLEQERFIDSLKSDLSKQKEAIGLYKKDLETKNHAKEKIHELEMKQEEVLSRLQHQYNQFRVHVCNYLNREATNMESTAEMIQECLSRHGTRSTYWKHEKSLHFSEKDCDDFPRILFSDNSAQKAITVQDCIISEAVTKALQEKDERCLLEKSKHVVLQKEVEELQMNLVQVTNDKVRVLMELAQQKHKYQKLLEEVAHRHSLGDTSDNMYFSTMADRAIKNLSHQNPLQLIRKANSLVNYSKYFTVSPVTNISTSDDVKSSREWFESLEHLTSLVGDLRLALVKVKETLLNEDEVHGLHKELDDIILKADLIKSASSRNLSFSCSAPPDDIPMAKADPVSAAGIEMAELLLLLANVISSCYLHG